MIDYLTPAVDAVMASKKSTHPAILKELRELTIEQMQIAVPVIVAQARKIDLPGYESTWELPVEERIALPAAYHQPVWDDLGKPHLWHCAQCWGEGWTTDWPCKVAANDGKAVALAGGMQVSG